MIYLVFYGSLSLIVVQILPAKLEAPPIVKKRNSYSFSTMAVLLADALLKWYISIVLGHVGQKIQHVIPIRRKMVTLGVDI